MDDINRERPIQKKIYLNEQENEKIKIRMEKHNLKNFSTFARYMMLSGKINIIDFSELNQLRVEINRIGVNINQIAKYINASEEVSLDDFKTLLSSLDEIEKLTSELLDKQQKDGIKAFKS